jgi:RNA polymerase sigma-70 factor (ECF subfamily)
MQQLVGQVALRGRRACLLGRIWAVAAQRPHMLSPSTIGNKVLSVALSEIDRNLLERCLHRKPRAWEDFVDRFMGLVVHVINHTAQCRSTNLSSSDREDLAAEVFLAIIDNDMAVLRHFRGKSSLATYLTVVARRVVVRKLVEGKSAIPLADMVAHAEADDRHPEQRISNQEEVGRLLGELQGSEAAVVRMYHLEGKSYQEISRTVGMPENSVGPMLSRARAKMRRLSGADQPAI